MQTQTIYRDDHPAEWHEERRRVIGGSDSPVLLMGADYPFETTPYDVWLAKVGMDVPKEPNAAMKRGTALEPIIAQLYAAQSSRYTVEADDTLQVHPKYNYIGGHIDRWLIDRQTGDRDGVLEIKCPGVKGFMACKREGPALYYQIQLQHYLATTGKQRGAFAIFNPELWELLTFDMERDEEMIGLILETDADFWNKYVLTSTPPETETVAAVYDKLPKIEFQTELKHIDSDEWQEAIENYRVAKELSEEAKMLEDEAKERIQQIMTAWDANVMEGRGARCYWKEQKGRATLDRKALAAAHPEIDLSQFEKISAPSRPLRVYLLNNKEVA